LADSPEDGTNGQTGPARYDAQDITVLEGLEAVRKRPGMYIGSTGVRGLHHLVYEVVDNSVDEALAGYCDGVSVTIHPDNRVTVSDNGRGIPVTVMEKEQKPAVEVVLTVLHAGGKFGDGGYKVSGGLHGVGISVVNALSEHLRVEVRREGFMWWQEYVRGIPQAPLAKGEPTDQTGTTVTFLPDGEIFESLDFEYATLEQRLRETAFLTRGCTSRSRTSAARAPARSSTTRAASRTSSPTSTRRRIRSTRRSSSSRARAAGPGRDRHAVDRLLPGVDLLVSRTTSTRTRALAPLGLPLRADLDAQPYARRQGLPQGARRQPLGRGLPRGAHRRRLGEADRPAVRGP
jgi:hypothetical protein